VKQVELPIEVSGHLSADAVKLDDSFDHEFGTEVRLGFDLENVQVLIFVNDTEIDITDKCTPDMIEDLKDSAMNRLCMEDAG
jgi:hypothetical protein